MCIEPCLHYEPDFEVESPEWYFCPEKVAMVSGTLVLPLREVSDLMLNQEARDWLAKSF
jgi:hypothetical protein